MSEVSIKYSMEDIFKMSNRVMEYSSESLKRFKEPDLKFEFSVNEIHSLDCMLELLTSVCGMLVDSNIQDKVALKAARGMCSLHLTDDIPLCEE